ncbi:hypothetical protein SDC9_51924 [bioreactor metagenome]|uniref:Beta-barrel assembly-enhancing protease n=1 Tax=bioreactor metagenome TaxID=1076179 RepID=A0A644WU87_9ZZZZ
MRIYYPLLLFVVIFISCRSNAQQMAMSEPVKETKSSIYKNIDEITSKIKSNPADENLLDERANLYLKINEFQSALDDIEAGLAINPKSDKLYNTQALIYYKKKRMDSALESINESIKLAGNEKNYFLRSCIFYSRGEIREAVRDLNEILKLNPRADYIYLQKAFWCNDLNMYYEEILNYMYYIKLSKDEVNVEQVKKRLKKIKKSDRYYSNLIKAAKKDIRKNGYPWEYQVWE